MPLKIEAYVDKTEDGGYEFYDRIGAVVVRVDGEVVKASPKAIKLKQVSDATKFRGPRYAITIPDDTPVSVQSWIMQSVQAGPAASLLEDDDLDA